MKMIVTRIEKQMIEWLRAAPGTLGKALKLVREIPLRRARAKKNPRPKRGSRTA